MPQKAKLTAAENIRRGDIIETQSHSKLGLVYTVMMSNGDGVKSFKIIPIHILDTSFTGKNDYLHLMIPNETKVELGFDATKQYEVYFNLEDIPAIAPDNILIQYARSAYVTHFGNLTLKRMDEILFDSLPRASDEVMMPIPGRSVPQFVLDERKPSGILQPDITLDEAVQLEILNPVIRDILVAGLRKDTETPTLRATFNLASSEKEKDQARIQRIFDKGIKTADVSLDSAFDSGLINEDDPLDVWRANGITTLWASQAAIKNNAPVLEQIENKYEDEDEALGEYFIEHYMAFPLEGFKIAIQESFERLKTMAATKDPKLTESGIAYMHPV
jgi:hypothetical protein